MLLDHSDATDIRNGVTNQPLTETEAAGRLGLKVATLRAWRHQGRGPVYVRLGRAVRYLPLDLEEFLSANRHVNRQDQKR